MMQVPSSNPSSTTTVPFANKMSASSSSEKPHLVPDHQRQQSSATNDSIKKENEQLRRELSALRAVVNVLQRKETEKTSLAGNLHQVSSTESSAVTVPRLVSPDRHDDRSSHRSIVMDDEDLSTSSCGLKHRKSPPQPQSRLLDTSSLMENGKYSMPSHHPQQHHDATELAPLVGSASASVGPPECNSPITFLDAVRDRASWLVGLLILQSMSSFIISRNESLLKQHLVIVQFLTMLVGAGGNGGNQSSVHVIRGLATGKMGSWKNMLWREVGMGLSLAIVLGVTGAVRAALFATPLLETVAITMSLVLIVFISVLLGAALPLLMQLSGIDPAHSSTTIQVLMDILGVTITVRTFYFAHMCSFLTPSLCSFRGQQLHIGFDAGLSAQQLLDPPLSEAVSCSDSRKKRSTALQAESGARPPRTQQIASDP